MMFFRMGGEDVNFQLKDINDLKAFRNLYSQSNLPQKGPTIDIQLPGIFFGWLYYKKGLENAMVSHYFADIGLHLIMPIILSLFK